MLQIIGWLGCAYLLVKALEIQGSRSSRDENGRMCHASAGAAALALLAALVFAVLFYMQGNTMNDAVGALSTGMSIDTGASYTGSTTELDPRAKEIALSACLDASPTEKLKETCRNAYGQ